LGFCLDNFRGSRFSGFSEFRLFIDLNADQSFLKVASSLLDVHRQ
jgi:hypothetical protein